MQNPVDGVPQLKVCLCWGISPEMVNVLRVFGLQNPMEGSHKGNVRVNAVVLILLLTCVFYAGARRYWLAKSITHVDPIILC